MRLIAAALSLSLAAQAPDARAPRAMESVEKNDADGLRPLLAQDPSLVHRTDAGLLPDWRWTLLHLATAHKASLDVVRALVDAGADVNARDNEGNTPLHFAVRRINETFPKEDYDGVVALLLEHKADVRLVNVTGASALHAAAAFRADRPAVEMLIHAGADVDLPTFKSAGALTPLHVAAEANDPGIVTVLLQYRARINVLDGRELMPPAIARRHQFWNVDNVFRAYIAARALNRDLDPSVDVSPGVYVAASGAGVVQGRLLWNGQPVAGTTVHVADDPRFGSRRYGPTTTDGQGRFSITGVSPGLKRLDVDGNQRVQSMSGGEPLVIYQPSMQVARVNQDLHVCRFFDLGSPAQNESVGSRPVLRWDAYPGARSYVVNVFDRNSWIALEWIVDAGTTSIQVDSDLPPGRYRWRVVVAGGGSDVIACNATPREFIVDRKP